MKNIFKNVTIEPAYFFFAIVYEWMRELDANLFLQKSCRLNTTFEPDLNTPCDNEKQGILFVSEVSSNYGFAVSFLTIIFVMFTAIWSDEAGRRRKPLILISILGLILHALSGCLNSYFWYWRPLAGVIPWAVIESFTGGSRSLVMFSQIYLCDTCEPESRTMRFGILAAIKAICLILGKAGLGSVLRRIGFFYFYLNCLVFSTISLILGVILVKDNSVRVEKTPRLKQMFTLKRVLLVDSFKVVFNRKLERSRVIVSMLMIVNVAVNFTFYGEMSVLYVYLRHRFKWNEVIYSDYLVYKFVAAAFGITFCSFVLSKRFKIHDGLIGILAGSFDTIAILGLLLATEAWQINLIPLIDMFHGTVFIVSLSFMSKYYDSNELGRLNAVIGALSLITPLCYPAYSKIFQNSLDTFPSAFCLLSLILDIGIVFCFVGAYFLSKKLLVNEKEIPAEEKAMFPSE